MKNATCKNQIFNTLISVLQLKKFHILCAMPIHPFWPRSLVLLLTSTCLWGWVRMSQTIQYSASTNHNVVWLIDLFSLGTGQIWNIWLRRDSLGKTSHRYRWELGSNPQPGSLCCNAITTVLWEHPIKPRCTEIVSGNDNFLLLIYVQHYWSKFVWYACYFG